MAGGRRARVALDAGRPRPHSPAGAWLHAAGHGRSPVSVRAGGSGRQSMAGRGRGEHRASGLCRRCRVALRRLRLSMAARPGSSGHLDDLGRHPVRCDTRASADYDASRGSSGGWFARRCNRSRRHPRPRSIARHRPRHRSGVAAYRDSTGACRLGPGRLGTATAGGSRSHRRSHVPDDASLPAPRGESASLAGHRLLATVDESAQWCGRRPGERGICSRFLRWQHRSAPPRCACRPGDGAR